MSSFFPLPTHPLSWISTAATTIAMTSILTYAVYQLFVSPLSSIPGPFWAKVTPFWLTLQCRRTERSIVVAAMHKKYGDVIRLAPNYVSINKPEALVQVYGHKSGFTKGPFYDAFMQVRPVVFTARDVPAHQRKRKYLNPAFAGRGMADFEPYMDIEVNDWLVKLDKMCDPNQAVDFCIWTNYLAFDIIGSFSFGQSFGFIKNGRDPYNLINTIDTRGEVLNALGTVPPSLRHWMRHNFFDDFWAKGHRARAGLEHMGREAFSKRKASITEKTKVQRRDLLSFLFGATDPETGNPLPDEEIIAESISFIVGGSDTTSSTMTNFIDLVSRNTVVKQALQAELDDAFPDISTKWVAPDNIVEKLPFLNATLREVMRYRPTSATGLERLAPPGGKVVGGLLIPSGTLVSVPTMGILHNETIYPHPNKFDPQRWLAPDTSLMLEYFQPFSYGPRSCIGRNFAWMEILKSMATLFRLFDIVRTKAEPTVIREGFFNKAAECTAIIEHR